MPSGEEDVLKSSGSLCGLNHKLLINLFKFKRAGVSVKRENQVLMIVNNNKQHDEAEVQEEISRLKISLMEKNTEVEKWKSLCLKQREEIKSLQSALFFPVDSSIISSQLQDLLDKFAFLKGKLRSLADDVALVKAETYSGRVNHDHTHFTSLPMTSLYDRGDRVKPQFDDQDYNTSCHYANSDHPDEYGAQGMYPYR